LFFTGFIASHVAILLCKQYSQYKIVVYDKLDYCSCLANLEELFDLPNFKFIKGDIASPDLVSYVLREEKIDTILHFAAQTHVDNSFGNSFAFTETNIYGTHVLLESAKCCKTRRRFVHVSTDEVYGEGEDFDTDPMSEEHVLEPTNPYAATKAGAEFLAKPYFRSFKLPCLIARGNNVYGPYQFPEKLIPKFTNQLMKGLPVTLHGDGSNTRNFLYVKDVATAFDTIMHKGTPGHVYNIGGKMSFPTPRSLVSSSRYLVTIQMKKSGSNLSQTGSSTTCATPLILKSSMSFDGRKKCLGSRVSRRLLIGTSNTRVVMAISTLPWWRIHAC
jgi:UDP-glucose 4,6-dehydratase